MTSQQSETVAGSVSDWVSDWAASVHPIDATRPHQTRVWNYLARGKDNYPVDRELAELLLQQHPEFADNAAHRLAFRARATRHLAQQGLDQFLVIGTDLPLENLEDEVHEIAERVTPGARVVYADTDPLVLAHARALLTGPEDLVGHVEGDLHDPDCLLIRAASVLDLESPVGVLLSNTLDLLSDQDAASALQCLADIVAAGSRFAVSYLTGEVNPEPMRRVAEVQREHDLPLELRDAADITRLLASLRLTGPAPMPCSWWHPGEPSWPGRDADPAVDAWCVVAVKDPP